MLDGDDLGFLALIFMPNTVPGFIAWVAMLITVGLLVMSNMHECAEMHCDNGSQAELLDGQCLCVEAAHD